MKFLGFLQAIAEAVAALGRYLRDRQLIDAGRASERSDTLAAQNDKVRDANQAPIRRRADPEYDRELRDRYSRD